MADLKLTRGIKELLDAYTAQDGELLFSTSTNELWLQDSGNRLKIGDFYITETEADRQSLISPHSKLYIVRETGNLWFWDSNGGWWMLLNLGVIQNRIVINRTMSVASSYGVPLEQGDVDNYTAHGTIMNVTENCYLNSVEDVPSKIEICCSQIPDSGVPTMVGIYRSLNGSPTLYRVCHTDVFSLNSIGWHNKPIIHIDDAILTTGITYAFVVFTQSNGTKLLGCEGSQINTFPYIGWSVHNLGNISTPPATLTPESENTNRLYGQISSTTLEN